MPTATVHIADVGGYAGPASCFKLAEPFRGHSYVTVWVQPGFGQHTMPEACLVPADETGACAETSLRRHPGSFVLHDAPVTVVQDPNMPATQMIPSGDKIGGAHWLALLLIGYTLEAD